MGFISLSATMKVSIHNHTKLMFPEVFKNEKNAHQSKSRSDRMNSQSLLGSTFLYAPNGMIPPNHHIGFVIGKPSHLQ